MPALRETLDTRRVRTVARGFRDVMMSVRCSSLPAASRSTLFSSTKSAHLPHKNVPVNFMHAAIYTCAADSMARPFLLDETYERLTHLRSTAQSPPASVLLQAQQ